MEYFKSSLSFPPTKLGIVLKKIEQERWLQNWMFPNQNNNTDVTADTAEGSNEHFDLYVAAQLGIPTAQAAKDRVEAEKASVDGVSWAAILVEEVAEAVEAASVKSIVELEKELVQVAAVAISWLEALQERT